MKLGNKINFSGILESQLPRRINAFNCKDALVENFVSIPNEKEDPWKWDVPRMNSTQMDFFSRTTYEINGKPLCRLQDERDAGFTTAEVIAGYKQPEEHCNLSPFLQKLSNRRFKNTTANPNVHLTKRANENDVAEKYRKALTAHSQRQQLRSQGSDKSEHKKLMVRKYMLLKKMLENEKQSNQILGEEIDNLKSEIECGAKYIKKALN